MALFVWKKRLPTEPSAKKSFVEEDKCTFHISTYLYTPEGDRLLGNGNPVPEELVQGGNREEKVECIKAAETSQEYTADEKTKMFPSACSFAIFTKTCRKADMEYLKIDGEFPRLSGSAVTLGKFDGIHRGHRKLVERILEQKEKGLQTVLFSLGIGSQMIFTKEERCRILEDAGVDILIECPLDARIRHMKADTFIKEILVGDLQAEHVAVGEDFRFGYERKGNPELLREMGKKLGFSVDMIPKEMEGKRKISSTFIREELKRGNMEKVNDLLGFPFFVDGVIEHGRGMGHKFLLPTTNIIPAKEKLMPPNGVYDTVSHFKDRSLKGITNVGYKPTVGEKFLGVETYLFDCEEDLYGEPCRVEFFHYSRPEKRFSSIEALKEQLMKDAEKGKAYFQSFEK